MITEATVWVGVVGFIAGGVFGLLISLVLDILMNPFKKRK